MGFINKKWSRELAEENRDKLLDELKKKYNIPEENLVWFTDMMNEMIDEQESIENKKNNEKY